MFKDVLPKFTTALAVALLMWGQLWAAPPPPGADPKRGHPSVKRGSIFGRKVGVIYDNRLPWRANSSISFSWETQPEDSDTKKFDAVIYSYSKEFHLLENTPTVNGTKVVAKMPILYPFGILDLHDKNYAQRYFVLETMVQDALVNIIKLRPEKRKIAILSFSHEVYFHEANILSFYLLSGIEQALRKFPKRKFNITFYTGFDVQNAIQDEYLARVGLAKQIDTGGSVKDLHISECFHTDWEVDRPLETEYFLERINQKVVAEGFDADGFAEALTPKELVRVMLTHEHLDFAPASVFEDFRTTMKSFFRNGFPRFEVVEAHLRSVIKNTHPEYTEEQLRTEAKALAAKLNNSTGNPFRKIGLYNYITDRYLNGVTEDKILKSIERVIRK